MSTAVVVQESGGNPESGVLGQKVLLLGYNNSRRGNCTTP